MVLIVALVIIWHILFPAMFPLNHLLLTTSIKRVEIENRPLKEVVQEVIVQVEGKSGKRIKIIFSPTSLAEWTREKDGGVFGNPPIEGIAFDALTIVAWDYCCNISYLKNDTILFYKKPPENMPK